MLLEHHLTQEGAENLASFVHSFQYGITGPATTRRLCTRRRSLDD
jgi:hypothetical protein